MEDSRMLRKRLASVLGGMPGLVLVGEAATVAEGRSELAEAKPDLVVLDLQLPDGTGFHLLETVSGMPAPPTVIVLTNFADPAYRRRALSRGAAYFFDKSVELDELMETLEELGSTER